MAAPVIALPGGVNPAALRYGALAEAVSDMADFHTKDLEVYAGDQPPLDYGIEAEVSAVARFADAEGLSKFHLLGYSGGGFISLAFAGTHADRLLSLALFEPARIPGPATAEEASAAEQLRAGLDGLEGLEFMQAFIRLQVRPGVELPAPSGPPPPWMLKRPAGLAVMMRAFDDYAFDRESLRRCEFPVFLGYGDLTIATEEVTASVLARLFPDIRIMRMRGVQHFVPAEQIYNSEHIAALRDLWSRPSPESTF
jgi:pimeloyl-ACP methyl ester carboxylesterase